MQREAGLNAKGYSERDEKRILDVLGRGLLREFPNPERAGCPGSELLRGIASHMVPLSKAEPWLEHLTSCSPCYRDFSRFREEHQRQRTRKLLAIAASILILACVAGWAVVRWQKETLVARTAVLDLRDRSVSRGGEPNPGERPLEISRAASHLNIYLPLGSDEGSYEVRIVAPSGELLVASYGTAKLSGYITSVRLTMALSLAHPGRYILQVRKTGSEWNSYPLVLR